METLKLINMGLRFLLELCFLAIYGYWGFKTGNSAVIKALLGLGAPILFVVVWGTFLAPKSSLRLDEPWRFLLELAILVLACWALYSSANVNLALIFGIIYILNKALMIFWRL